MHHYCVCLPALRPRSSRASSASPWTTTVPPPTPARGSCRAPPGRRPATRANNGRTRRRARACPRPGRRRRGIGAERRHRARKHVHRHMPAAVLHANISSDACLDRWRWPAARHGLQCMSYLLGVVPLQPAGPCISRFSVQLTSQPTLVHTSHTQLAAIFPCSLLGCVTPQTKHLSCPHKSQRVVIVLLITPILIFALEI